MKANKEDIIIACKTSATMSEAATKLGLHFNTFKRYAVKLGCYAPNQGGKGLTEEYIRSDRFDTKSILAGEHPEYQTGKLKLRLYKENILKEQCVECGIGNEYNDKPITLELDHINGIRHDHRLSNLRILCPNCHSQTNTYRFKKRKKK